MKGITDQIQGIITIDNLRKYCLHLIDVNRTICHRLTQLLPFIQVPFECFGMGIVIFGLDVAVNSVGQGDSIGSFERNRQLIRHSCQS